MAATGSTVNTPSGGDLSDTQIRTYRNLGDGSVAGITTTAGDWSYSNLTASGNTLVKTGAGSLHQLLTGTATGNVTIYDGTTSGGTLVYGPAALVVGPLTFDISFAIGLFIVLSGAGVATATYR